jgi:hypothetical protein
LLIDDQPKAKSKKKDAGRAGQRGRGRGGKWLTNTTFWVLQKSHVFIEIFIHLFFCDYLWLLNTKKCFSIFLWLFNKFNLIFRSQRTWVSWGRSSRRKGKGPKISIHLLP